VQASYFGKAPREGVLELVFIDYLKRQQLEGGLEVPLTL